ncbi:MAG: putative 2OG-Fe(II) oxygenase [Pseudomonadota bacterium]
MIRAEQAIASGYAAFKRRDFVSARKALSGVKHPQAIHLLGLVEKAAGNFSDADKLLVRAAKLDPSNHEIANNQGLLARTTGELERAEQSFRRALKLKPGFQSAEISLGRTLHDQGKHKEAIRILQNVVKRDPRITDAHTCIALAAIEERDIELAETHVTAANAIAPTQISVLNVRAAFEMERGNYTVAEDLFRSILSQGGTQADIHHMLSRALLMKPDPEAARAEAERAFELAPTSEHLLFLADIYWMAGDISAFDDLVLRALDRRQIAIPAISLLRKAGREEWALAALTETPTEIRESAAGLYLKCGLLLDLDRAEEAVRAGERAYAKDKWHRDPFHIVRALIATQKYQKALDIIMEARARDPEDQFWLGYEITVLRLMNDPKYNELIDYDRHVQAYHLPVPEGFETIDEFNRAFLEVLDELSPFETEPLNQSLRSGSQTPQNLCAVRNPVVQAYFRALDKPIRDYMEALGSTGEHPSSVRNTGEYRFSGAWSVNLTSGGYHVNHVHPKGWISSAYYVQVPPETSAGKDKTGWIKFGEPPIETTPPLVPEKWVQPEAGLLVLFPSFLWHGTEPIKDGSVRVTAPFDVVPA